MKTYQLTEDIQIIGRAGELGGIRIAIDVSAWQVTEGGVYGILCTRPDGRRWPLVTEMLDGWLTAVLPAECTDRPGTYEYTATWVKAGQMSISRSYRAIILSGGVMQPPGRLGTPDWAREIYLRAEEAVTAADRAVEAANIVDTADNTLRRLIVGTMANVHITSGGVQASNYYLSSELFTVDEYTLMVPDSGYSVGVYYYGSGETDRTQYTGASGYRTDYVTLQKGKLYAAVFVVTGVDSKLAPEDLRHLHIFHSYGKPAYTFTSDTGSRTSMGRIREAGTYFFSNAELKAFTRSNELPSDIGSANGILINTPYYYNGIRFTYQQLLTVTDPIRIYTRYCQGTSVYQNWKPMPNKAQMDAAIAAAVNGSAYAGKRLSIYGDSISTFAGWIPEGNESWYYTNGNGMPNGVEDSWWKKLLGALGMALLVNNSWSGRRVGGSQDNAGWKQANIAVLADGTTLPDVVIVEMGINDFVNGRTLGTYDGTGPVPAAADDFLSAYGIMLDGLMTAYPLAEIWCCGLMACEYRDPRTFPETNANGDTLADWNRAIERLATAFGARMIRMDQCGITTYNLPTYMGDWQDASTDDMVHPNAAGHSLMANQAIRDMDPGIRTRFD